MSFVKTKIITCILTPTPPFVKGKKVHLPVFSCSMPQHNSYNGYVPDIDIDTTMYNETYTQLC